MLRINAELSIQLRELRFTFSRSSGPGGQNVNKVSTRVTLLFDVASSPSLSDLQRERISRALASRLTQDGILRIDAGEARSQAANREMAVERFTRLLAGALRVRKKRTKTRPTRASVERRLGEKSRRSERKRWRSGRSGDSD